MRAKRAVVVLFVVAGILALAPPAPAQEAPTRYVDEVFPQVDVTKDHVYGEAVNSRGEDETLLFDLYEPNGDTATDRALLIWVFGSGFRVGSRGNGGPLRDYAERGWVGMAITYRLRPELPPNAFVGIVTNPQSVTVAQAAARDAQHDLQAAVRYARANAVELGIDPNKIVVGGISAGGITALAAAFNEDDPGNSGTPGVSSRVAAAVSHAGAYVPVLQGGFPKPGAPPVAYYHGTHDEQVPFGTQIPGCVLTILVGNHCELVTFVAREHATMGVNLAQDFLYRHVILPNDGPQVPVNVSVDDEATALAGVEHVVGGLGATAGVVVPLDPYVYVDRTVFLVQYLAGAFGLG